MSKMNSRSNDHLAVRREAYRLWFEYLKLARQSRVMRVQSKLYERREFYGPWEMDKADKFDAWWKTHGHLFEERYVVKALTAGELPSDAEALVVEIPLTKSPTLLTRDVKKLIQAAYESHHKTGRKSKKRPTAHYKLTEDTEPKLQAVREMLTVYRDAYLKNPSLRGKKLLEAVHQVYLSRPKGRRDAVPKHLKFEKDNEESLARALRNVRRYIQKAERIVSNVANGEFPGSYDGN